MKKQLIKMKGNKGITLIALVITIIVLLLLAGVSMSMLGGQDGIITKTNNAKVKTELANISEALAMESIQYEMDLKSPYKNVEEYLIAKGILNEDNIINTQKILGKESNAGTYKLESGRLVLLGENGKILDEVESDILQTKAFITEWTVEANDVIVLPIATGYIGDNNFIVDWGDGSEIEKVDDSEEIIESRPRHTYTKAGKYRITITGKCRYFMMSEIEEKYPEQRLKLTKLVAWGEIDARNYNFDDCSNLAGAIPSPEKNTFLSYCEDGETADLNYLFEACSSITSIPADLFANIPEGITSFVSTFSECTSLTAIPAGLFDKAVNAESFEKTFDKCTNLEILPQGLFDNNTKVTNFRKTFYRCNNIREIPLDIFDNIPNITNLNCTFYDLRKITAVPELWTRTTEGLDGTSCFGSCDLLDSSDIPAPWADTAV